MMIRYNAENDQTNQEAGLPTTGTLSDRIRERLKQYVLDEDPAVKEHLEWFQDQKLGLMVHFGLYSQLGMKESWPLIDLSSYGNNPKWTRWQFPEDKDPKELKYEYSQLHKTFNPVRFDPDEWAEFAEDTGFKYLLFTTKHHDGFCMWDTKTTPYSLTGPETPYRTNRNADMARKLFDAFRNRGMGISVYYSKPDWGSPLYWEPGYLLNTGITSGIPSYDPKKKPALWEQFVQYTHEQLRELGLHSGKIDCMWFDGGVVSKRIGLDVRIGEIMDEIRQSQPWVLSADRGQGGKYENFLTPELEIPETVLPVPWETCLCLGKRPEGERYTSFGYTYDQDYYTASETLQIFLEIISRGGNLALNIAPQPDGRLPARAMRQLKAFGRWMKLHAEGIYGTRPCEPYFNDAFRYLKKENLRYVYRLYRDDEPVPAEMTFEAPFPAGEIIYMRTGESLRFERKDGQITVQMPLGMIGLSGLMADGFRVL